MNIQRSHNASVIRKIAYNLILALVLLVVTCQRIAAQEEIVVINNNLPLDIGKKMMLLFDSGRNYSPSNIVLQNSFQPSKLTVPIFPYPIKDLWVKFTLKNYNQAQPLFLSVKDPNISDLFVYEHDSLNKLSLISRTGTSHKFYKRQDNNVEFNFRLNIPVSQQKTYYLKINSVHPVELRLVLYEQASLDRNNFIQNIIIGVFSGIIIATFLYNLFLFFGTKDRSYLIYVSFVLTIGFALITFAGWSFKLFWPSLPLLNKNMIIITSCMSGLLGISFAKSFLHIASYTPRINKVLSFLMALYVIAIIMDFTNLSWLSYSLFNLTGIAGGMLILYASIYIYRKGFRSAYFYFLAWSVFLSGLIIYLLKNLNILPTNNFTHYILFFGSAIEATLLSIALADKINILQKEKTQSQAEALRVSRENEILVKEQNIVLEQKVNERTEELQHANHQLNDALTNLKDAQTQLVEAEKMASLGQLTAGIAHEINNPINFVKSNIKPLQLDFRDLEELIDEYNKLHTTDEKAIKSQLSNIASFQKQIDLSFVKTEIGSLIKGIEEGAERTAEIVRGLRTFSRLDEGELKTVNVHEGIDSTLVLLKNSFPYYIKIVKDFKADGNIDCYPGKLNQVFMNIINNGIQAIQAKPTKSDNETIVISTKDADNERIIISIKDSGTGMTDEVKQKIFEPFFTTKPVGEGTGLGMAIVFKIIEKHNGKIDILSSPDNGAEFILSLPHALSETSHNPR